MQSCCLSYSSILNMEEAFSLNCRLTFNGLNGVIYKNIQVSSLLVFMCVVSSVLSYTLLNITFFQAWAYLYFIPSSLLNYNVMLVSGKCVKTEFSGKYLDPRGTK